MFGVKLKSWMEAHLGRPRHKSTNQKRAGKSSETSSMSLAGTVSSSSTSFNSSQASSNSSSTTAIHPQSNPFSVKESSSSTPGESNSSCEGSGSLALAQDSAPIPVIPHSTISPEAQNASGAAAGVGTHSSALVEKAESHPLQMSSPSGESDQKGGCASSTRGSVSNSTSILSGSSFSNSLSSPDTGYSTDGYSPKSVYPALSFDTSAASAAAPGNKCSPSTTQIHLKSSSYTISSLVSSDVSSLKQNSLSLSSTNELDSAEEGVVQLLAPHPYLSSGGNSDNRDNIRFHPKGERDNNILLQHIAIIPEGKILDGDKTKEDVIMNATDTISGEKISGIENKSSLLLPPPPESTCTTDVPLERGKVIDARSTAFAPINIDLNNHDFSSSKPHGRTHRRAESMDARTPSQEDYKPLVRGDEGDVDPGGLSDGGGNPSSCYMTSAKNIRTSFMLNSSGQIVEFSSCKNAFSICSPRRERTRIKTNPWIILSNKSDANSQSKGDKVEEQIPTSSPPHNPPLPLLDSSKVGIVEDEQEEKCNHHPSRNTATTTTTTISTSISDGDSRGSEKNLEINNKRSDGEVEESFEDETRITDDPDSSLVYRVSTASASASDSGKGTLDEGTNRNSTESSCLLLSDSASAASTRNSIISQEAERLSSGEESFSSSSCLHQHSPERQCVAGKVRSKNTGGTRVEEHQRTFRNAAVSTELHPPFPKSTSVSVGVGTTSSNKSAKGYHLHNHQHQGPIMVDKETDILSDWANTDEDYGDEDIETDRLDNETVTPAPSSPGRDSDVDRALFSQSTSSATDIDFGDSSAATQASSTQVFPPSSLVRQSQHHHHHHQQQNLNNRYGNGGGGDNVFQVVESGESVPRPGGCGYDHNINGGVYPSVPIIRPVLAAAQQHHSHGPNGIPDAYAYDIGQHSGHGHLLGHHHHHRVSVVGGGIQNFNLREESDYPEILKSSSGSKGLARGALGFLRKIFKKGACSSQRHQSPDGKCSKKSSKGKSDNNLAALGLVGSPLLTISEPLSNPRYSSVLTKKQLNPGVAGYFLTPTPNSFRRRSGGAGGGGGGSGGVVEFLDNFKNGSGKQKIVKTDIIRLPQGTLSPQQQQQQQLTNSSSSASSSTTSAGGNMNGNNCSRIPETCSATFLSGLGSNPNNTNSNSTSSSIHSLMSTSTSISAGNRPPSQSMRPSSGGQGDLQNYASPQTQRQSYGNSNNTNRISPPPAHLHDLSTGNKYQQQQNSFQSQIPPRRESRDSALIKVSSSSSQGNIIPPAPPYDCATSSPHRVLPPGSNARMNSPSFNNSYSPIHRLVVTGGSHLLSSRTNNPNCPPGNGNPSNGSLVLIHGNPAPSNPPINPLHPPQPFVVVGSSGGGGCGSTQLNRPPSSTQSPLINHRYSNTTSTSSSPHPYQQQHHHNMPPPPPQTSFASPSPILRNPRYQYITSSNQNSPVLNGGKRTTTTGACIPPQIQHHPQNGFQTPILTTFSPVPHQPTPSSSSSSSCGVRENVINNNTFHNLNSQLPIPESFSQGRHIVSSSVSYNEFENLSKGYPHHNHHHQNGNGVGVGPGAGSHHLPFPHQPQKQLAPHPHQKLHHTHYYSSPIVKDCNSKSFLRNSNGLQQNNFREPRGEIVRSTSYTAERQQQQRTNQNMRFNSFLVRHRQLPQFYHTQWGLQERIYETVDSEDDRSPVGMEEYLEEEEVEGGCEGDQVSELSLPVEVHHRQGMDSFPVSFRENYSNPNSEQVGGSQRSKPKSLSASGRPFPRALVALPMMPGTFLSETETRLLEADKDADSKYKRLITEAEALLKEISVEKSKRAKVVPGGNGNGGMGKENHFRLEDCPQSDPLRRKAYDCWALRRLQQELAGCCASPPVLHRSRLNLQSPSTPTGNPYLNQFQQMSGSHHHAPPQLQLPHQVPYMSSAQVVDSNQNTFDF